jgi:predicted DNA-binding transcriptional regulator AlpA
VVNNNNKKNKKFVRTLTELAVRLGVNRGTIYEWRKKDGFPKKTKKGYSVEKCRQWRLTWYDAEEELVSAGPVSPWLEKYRAEKTKLLRLERLSRMGLLRSAEETAEMIQVVANRLRQAIQQVQVEFGEGPFSIMTEALADLERTFEHWQPQTSVESLLDSTDQDGREPADCTNKKGKRNHAKR